MIGNFRRWLTLIVTTWALSACTSMSLTGMYKLSQMDPLTTDPAQLKVAIKTDKAIQVKDGAAKIKFGYTSDDGSIAIDDTYLVAIDRNASYAHSLFDEITPQEYVTVLSLTEQDARKLQQNQQRLLAYKQQEKKGTGFISIELSDFCLPTPLPERELVADVYLQTNIQEGFFKFLSDVDIKEQAENIEQASADTVSSCS